VDAIVVAGGAARRMGGADKPGQRVGDRTMLGRVVDAVRDVAAHTVVVVVGPRHDDVADVVWCIEEPAGGGPVAAIAAGLQHTSSDVVLVLAADLPEIGPAVPLLIDALRGADCAVLVDANGRRNPLAAAWRRAQLQAAIAGIGEVAGAAARAMLDGVLVAEVPDAGGWGTDCDTWDDLAAARRRAAAQADRRTS